MDSNAGVASHFNDGSEPARSSRPRRVAQAAGILCLALVGGGIALSWREIGIAWYERKLEAHPEALIEMLRTPSGSLEGEAAIRYARKPNGRVTALEAYLSKTNEANSSVQRRLTEITESGLENWFLAWAHSGSLMVMGYVDMPNWSFRGGGGGGTIRESLRPDIEALQKLLEKVGVEKISLPDRPGVEFTLRIRKDDEPERAENDFKCYLDWSEWPAGRVLVGYHKRRNQRTP